MDGDSQSRNQNKNAGSIGEREQRLDGLLDAILAQSQDEAAGKKPAENTESISREQPSEKDSISQELPSEDEIPAKSQQEDNLADAAPDGEEKVSAEGDAETKKKRKTLDFERPANLIRSEDEPDDVLALEEEESSSPEAEKLEAAILSQIKEDNVDDQDEMPENNGLESSYDEESKRPASSENPLSEIKFEPEKDDDNKFTKKDFFSLVLYVLLVFSLTFVIVHYVGQRTRVSGSSMENTLSDGDNLIVDKISYRFSDPERFDIIIFPPRGDEEAYYIKRIIGLPGETVQIDDKGNIYINGEILDEDYGLDVIADPGTAREPVTLGKDEFFVLGDNRNNSTDSRWPTVGAVERDDIIGRAWVRIYPFNKIKGLTDKE